MPGLVQKLTELARSPRARAAIEKARQSPQARAAIEKARQQASTPENRRRLEQLRARWARRP